MKNALLFTSLLSVFGAFSQQPSPIGIIYNPRINKLAISGVGGGNLYEFSTANSSTSGQFALDWNIEISDKSSKKGKDKYTTLTPVFKYNPFLRAKYNTGDSLSVRKLAFIDNEFALFFGVRFNTLKEFGNDANSKSLNSGFFDFSYTPYSLSGSAVADNTGFSNFNMNLGYQWGIISNTDFGVIGVILSPQLNFISVYEDKLLGTSLEEMMNISERVSRNYLGAGAKLNIPVNDFSFFFEIRKYVPLNTSFQTPGLTDRTIFSVGGVATGTVFKTRTKESRGD